ncbi:MAG: sigma-70 family RNA polymerase sigma factor [bacterium]|nr:sigma-70 family RNA polymerase sigma factor [bacterium]
MYLSGKILTNKDLDIVKRALDGEQDAYNTLLKKYRGAIYSLVYKMVKNREEAEDLVQETFIKAFSALATFNAQYAFSTWLFKIASNNCIDYLRKKRLQTMSIDKPTEAKDGPITRELPDPIVNPEAELIDTERKSIIEVAIDSLPAKYRIAILMRHKEEKSYEEIAEALNVPLGTVKARIFRAREKLKKHLKNQF